MACDNPTWIRPKGVDMPVPCGRCAPCKIRRVNEWCFRLMWEEEHNSVSSHFVTLTYDTEHVPLTSNGFMSLDKTHFQLYMKRLRKICQSDLDIVNGYCGRVGPDSYSLKYYACGEYGSLYGRPHYHAIVFNCQDAESFAKAWSIDGVQFGDVHVGTCTTDSVAYCMKYIDKDNVFGRRYRHSRDDRAPEFSLMSKALGIGYVQDPFIQRYHRADLSRNFLTKLSGHRVAMPRYYRLKLFSDFELDLQRDLISAAVEQADLVARAEHLASGLSYSYMRKIEYEREGRAYKFRQSMKKRDRF